MLGPIAPADMTDPASSRKAVQSRLMVEERARAEQQRGDREPTQPMGVVKWVSLGIQIGEDQ